MGEQLVCSKHGGSSASAAAEAAAEDFRPTCLCREQSGLGQFIPQLLQSLQGLCMSSCPMTWQTFYTLGHLYAVCLGWLSGPLDPFI